MASPRLFFSGQNVSDRTVTQLSLYGGSVETGYLRVQFFLFIYRRVRVYSSVLILCLRPRLLEMCFYTMFVCIYLVL